MTIDEIKRRAHDAVEIMLLRQQVRAGQVIIATMAKRMAEMELKNSVKRAEKTKDQRRCPKTRNRPRNTRKPILSA